MLLSETSYYYSQRLCGIPLSKALGGNTPPKDDSAVVVEGGYSKPFSRDINTLAASRVIDLKMGKKW